MKAQHFRDPRVPLFDYLDAVSPTADIRLSLSTRKATLRRPERSPELRGHLRRQCIGNHKSFQFSSCILENFRMFSVVWMKREKIPFSAGTLSSFGFSFAILVFLDSEHSWTYIIWSGSRLNFCWSLPGPQKSVWRFLFQQSKLSETCPRIRQIS